MSGKKYQIFLSEKQKKKYRGDCNNIILRSSWEYDFFCFLMKTPSTLFVSSEEIMIPYTSRVNGRRHRYFPDFYFIVKDKDGVEREYLTEVKPFHETQIPDKKNKKRYKKEMRKYLINISKWETAYNWCYERGIEFVFLTDDPLNKKRYKMWKFYDIGLPYDNMRLLG